MTLETKRLVLRSWQPSDAEDLFEHARDPRVGPAAGWPVHTSVEHSMEIIRTVLSVPETYAICLRTNGRVIGSIGLKMGENTDMTDREDEAEIGYWIGVPYWGNGYVPEAVKELLRHAFTDMDLSTVWCGYYHGNDKSRRVQEKCGFQYHHTSETVDVPLLGEVRTEHVSCLTRKEWENNINEDTK